MINVSGMRRDRERPKKTLIETMNKDSIALNLTRYMTLSRSQWQQKINVADPK